MALNKDNVKLNIVAITDDIKKSVENTYDKLSIVAIGEIVGYKVHSSGHAYFSLKEGSASLSGTFFKFYRDYGLKIIDETGRRRDPKDGEIVKVTGKITIYPNTSSYQIKAEVIELANKETGMFAKTYEETLKKLIAENILHLDSLTNTYSRINPPIKELPAYPKKIAILTAKDGAVINDFISTTIEKHGIYEIDLYNIHVQNIIYAQEIVNALKLADSKGIYDVIVLMRGGGSKEDLSLFNSYDIAKAIISLNSPVVVSTGHQNDVTIAEIVSDKRAGTPTFAATILCNNYSKVDLLIDKYYGNILHHMESYHTKLIMTLDYTLARLEKYSPENIVKSKKLEVDKNIEQLKGSIGKTVSSYKNHVDKVTYTLSLYNPKITIKNYSIQLINNKRNLTQSIDSYVNDLSRKVRELENKLVFYTKNNIENIRKNHEVILQRLNLKNTRDLISNYNLHVQSMEKQLKLLIKSKQTKDIIQYYDLNRKFKDFIVNYNYNINTTYTTLNSKLNLLNPENILDRGYAIISQNGQVVSNIEKLNVGDVEIKFKDGTAYGEINSIDNQNIFGLNKSEK